MSSTEEMKARDLVQVCGSDAQVGVLSGQDQGMEPLKGEHTRLWKSSLQQMGL